MNRAEELTITRELLGINNNDNNQQQKVLYVIGTDEAGRGPLCGPVVCGSAVLYFDNSSTESRKNVVLTGLLAQLGDSKKINETTRDKLYAELLKQEEEFCSSFTDDDEKQNTCIATSTISIDAQEIDELNILEASLHGMERAADEVLKKLQQLFNKKLLDHEPTEENTVVLIDGPHLCRSLRRVTTEETVKNDDEDEKKKNQKTKKAKKANPKAEREAEARKRILKPVFGSPLSFIPKGKAVIKGDAKCPSISAASILAKVKRDEIMSKEVAPNVDKRYNLLKNKGYPTAEHMDAVEKIGATKYHRRSFTPVRLAIEKFEKNNNKKAKKEVVEKKPKTDMKNNKSKDEKKPKKEVKKKDDDKKKKTKNMK